MATLTLTVPEDLKRDLKLLKGIDWSAIAREAIRQRVAQVRLLNALAAKSTLSKKEALEFSVQLGRKVRAGVHERHVQKYGG